ncbi:type VII secretion protein EccCb [Actinoplanes couchii]|uniref:ESX-4 secretion system protein EccC4 n=1 Tax=Actinoplanes couchii TaxID=403638 RepID=A0ABQ3WZP9_9ACTN|nr:type VII secretion protein EccCb [Actinoplanes couchii]MDR6316145.1 S-DNA-T family DNA segregation ATPase FtsK/SpoIIIE [Actinoplanes couchii]GID51760.1 ESX-4 secretion system protein EccC4 [Actinoplanes couchii]
MDTGMFRRPPRQPGPEPVTGGSPVDHLRQLSRQRTALLWRHPEPASLAKMVGSSRMWERRPGDEDFAEVRVAVDARKPTVDIAALEPPAIEDLETSTAIAVPHLPLSVRLRAFSRVTLRGEREPVTGLTRAMLAQLAVLHSPEELRIAVVAAPGRMAEWDWARQLPHTRTPAATLVFETLLDLEKTLGKDLSDRPRYDPAAKTPTSGAHLVVILDGGEVAPTCRLVGVGPKSTTVVDLSGQAPGGAGRWLLRLNVTATAVAVDTPRQTTPLGTPDLLPLAQAEELSRRLSARQPAGEQEGTGKPPVEKTRRLGHSAVLTDLLGIPDAAALDPRSTWQPDPGAQRFRVPIGTGADGTAVELDLGEHPHGLIVGATGSGKSELLRTIVTAFAVTHTPSEINFLLLDYRGGVDTPDLDGLPHTSAILSDLEGEVHGSDRLHQAILGELQRRRDLPDVPGMPRPRLLVVIDGFDHALDSRPDITDVLLAIARDGADLGVHLLLAGSRFEEGRLRGLDSHLTYRIGMRTFSAAESSAVIGVPDAHELPNRPGAGYLKAGASSLQWFKVAAVSCPYSGPDGPALLAVITGRLADQGPPAHRILLAPLVVAPNITDLLDGERPARLTVPVGVTDRPYDQRQEPYLLELGGTAGNVAVVGGDRSGKSTLLRTLIAALALTHGPREVQFFGIDLGGGGLQSLDGLPHLSALAGRADTDTIRRTLAEIGALIDAREARFTGHADSDDPFGEVFLVIDGWAELCQDHRDIDRSVLDLATRGLGYGVHVVLTATHWAQIPGDLREVLATRIELRLADPKESEIDRQAARRMPETPGCGLTREGLHFLTAVPRIDGHDDLFDAVRGAADLVARARADWPDERAPRLRLLPRLLPAAELTGPGIPIGIDEVNLAPVRFDDAESSSHLVIFGDPGSGKTNLLRLIARSVAHRYALDEARLVLIDYRRTLLGAVDGEHLLTHATSGTVLADAIGSIQAAMSRRLPGPDVTREQLRDRSWWRGPDLFILVDDYDLVVTPGNNPLSGLVELIPYARDIGLHLIIARRSKGAGRAVYEPLLRRLEQVDSPVLVMSGDPEEGKLFGRVRPRPQPPGRGVLSRHSDGTTVLQTAWSDPEMPSLASTSARTSP